MRTLTILSAVALAASIFAPLAAQAASSVAPSEVTRFDLRAMSGPNWGPLHLVGGPFMPDGRRIEIDDMLSGKLVPPPAPPGLAGAAAAKAHIARAKDYFAFGERGKAIAALTSAVAAQPRHVEALHFLARLIAVSDPTRALFYAKRAVAAVGASASADLYATQAAIAALEGDQKLAALSARRAISLDPHHELRLALVEPSPKGAQPRGMVGKDLRRALTASLEMADRMPKDPRRETDAAISGGAEDPLLRVRRAYQRIAANDPEGTIADITTLFDGGPGYAPVKFAPGFAATLRWLRADAALKLRRTEAARADMRAGAFEADAPARLRAQLAMASTGVEIAIDGADTPAFRRAYETCLASPACLGATVAFHRPADGAWLDAQR